jgi:hypothetical protein
MALVSLVMANLRDCFALDLASSLWSQEDRDVGFDYQRGRHGLRFGSTDLFSESRDG